MFNLWGRFGVNQQNHLLLRNQMKTRHFLELQLRCATASTITSERDNDINDTYLNHGESISDTLCIN